jgi:Protein of unknown function (DUF2493).
MRIAIIGSGSLTCDIGKYIPAETTEIVSGGARGVDRLAERWADERRIPKLIIKPDYARYGKAAPLWRNFLIVDLADSVVAVWDGQSLGTMATIRYARKTGKPVQVHIIDTNV